MKFCVDCRSACRGFTAKLNNLRFCLCDPMRANHCLLLESTVKLRQIANFRYLLYFYK